MRLGLGLYLGAAHGAYGGGFDPASLFAAGEQGAWYDVSDLSSMYQDAAGTTPAVVGQPVGRIEDKSGRGNHATQSTTASKPILRQSGALYYLEFDGVDDFLVTGNINFTSTDEMSVFAGVRKLANTQGMLAELSVASTSNNGSFNLQAPQSATNRYFLYSRGDAVGQTFVTDAAFDAPITNVLSASAKIATDTCQIRLDGVLLATGLGDQGTGNYGNYPLYIGRRGGTSLPFNGRLYSLIVRGKLTDGENLTNTETYVAGKTGVTL